MSASVSRPVRSTVRIESRRALSGSLRSSRRAPPAWTTIALTLWAMMSCSSLPIRTRSCAIAARSRSWLSGRLGGQLAERGRAADGARAPGGRRARGDEQQATKNKVRADPPPSSASGWRVTKPAKTAPPTISAARPRRSRATRRGVGEHDRRAARRRWRRSGARRAAPGSARPPSRRRSAPRGPAPPDRDRRANSAAADDGREPVRVRCRASSQLELDRRCHVAAIASRRVRSSPATGGRSAAHRSRSAVSGSRARTAKPPLRAGAGRGRCRRAGQRARACRRCRARRGSVDRDRAAAVVGRPRARARR